MTGERCADCRFVRPSRNINAEGLLECHRSSPTVPTPHDLAAAVQLGRAGNWPVVDADAWCGEWRPEKGEGL